MHDFECRVPEVKNQTALLVLPWRGGRSTPVRFQIALWLAASQANLGIDTASSTRLPTNIFTQEIERARGTSADGALPRVPHVIARSRC